VPRLATKRITPIWFADNVYPCAMDQITFRVWHCNWFRSVVRARQWNNSLSKLLRGKRRGPVGSAAVLTLRGCVVYARPPEDGRWPPSPPFPALGMPPDPPLVMSRCISSGKFACRCRVRHISGFIGLARHFCWHARVVKARESPIVGSFFAWIHRGYLDRSLVIWWIAESF
jgi:hypothetical protein